VVNPVQKQSEARRFPLLGGGSIPWEVAEIAYRAYAKRYGTDQSLERLAERGGLAKSELDVLHPSWREETDETLKLRVRIAALEEALEWYATEAEAIGRNMTAGKSDMALMASMRVLAMDAGKRARALLAHKEAEPCVHEWVDARNEYVTSGELCRKCHAIRPAEPVCPECGGERYVRCLCWRRGDSIQHYKQCPSCTPKEEATE
jgi:xanthine/CO dehydrogenase XdhC/CoxF family maturation factor